MNLIETLVSRATEEACELGKAFSKLNGKGIKAVDPESGQPLVLDAIKQLNEILAAVELLRDRGVPLAGIGDPVAIGEAKNLIVQDMEEAMKNGSLTLSEDDQNPRPEGVNEAGAGLPEDGGDGDGQGDGDDDLGEDGTGADGDDGASDGNDGDGMGGDDNSAGDGDLGDDGEGGGGEEEGGDEGEDAGDGSDTDSEDGDDGDGTDEGDDGDDESSEEDEESEEEEEEEPGSNDV